MQTNAPTTAATALKWVVERLAEAAIRKGERAPEMVKGWWDRALVEAEARANPGAYRTCSACGSGPWHRSWTSWDGVPAPRGRGKSVIGPCCSGAD